MRYCSCRYALIIHIKSQKKENSQNVCDQSEVKRWQEKIAIRPSELNEIISGGDLVSVLFEDVSQVI